MLFSSYLLAVQQKKLMLLAGACLPLPSAFDLGAVVISHRVPWELPFLLYPRAKCAVVFSLVVFRSLVTEMTLNHCASYLLFDVPPAHMFRIRF